MLIRYYFAILIMMMRCSSISQEQTKKPLPKTNSVYHFHPDSLKTFVKDYKFVVILHNKPKTKKGRMISKWFFEVAKVHDVNEVFFLQIHMKQTKKNSIFKPKIEIFVYGFKKIYHGDMKPESLQNWINDIVKASPTKIASIADIEKVDSHYFAYIDEKWLEANKTHLIVLTKLISPLNIFTGLPEEERNKLTKNKPVSTPLWVYREYNNEVIEVDINLSLKKKATFILNNEFPPLVLPNSQSYRLITEFMAPVLIYFTKDKDDEFIDIIEKIAKPYKDYLITMPVVPNKKDKTVQFFINFMGIDNYPALRILNMQDDIKRYKYMGDLDPHLIEYFLQNYKKNNLKPYILNEKVKKGNTVNGFLKANHEKFKRLLTDKADANLIYVYSSYNGKSQEHLSNLELIESVFRENKNFKVYLIDQDKNDLDGYFRHKLPILLLTAPPKQIYHFEGEYNFTNLANFIITKLPHMKLSEPEFTDEL